MLIPRDILHGSSAIFLYALASIQNPGIKKFGEFPIMQKSLKEVLGLEGNEKEIELVITFVQRDNPKGDIVQNVPEIKVQFT